MRITTLALLGLGLSFAACRGSSNNGDDDPGTPDAPGGDGPVGPVEARVQDIQNDTMPKGTAVTIKGVVVVAIDAFGARRGELWVQDPAGGAFSGIKVFNAPAAQTATLTPGDLVDIAGAQKDEFALLDDKTGRAVTELKPAAAGTMTITKKGRGTVPAPEMVDAAAISAMPKAAREAEWEKWEGVLITVKNARQIAELRTFGDMAADQSEFRITGVARVQSSLVALPEDNDFGVCYDRITGIGDYVFNDLVLPRSADDIAAGGVDCLPFATNVVAVQTTPNSEGASLKDVFVTARDDIGNNKGIWVSDSLEAAPNNGVFVFTGGTLAANLQIGATVNIAGIVEEFDLAPQGMPLAGDKVTEITGGTPVFVAAPGPTLPSPVVVSPATLSDIGTAGEPYEGVLVQVNTVKLTKIVNGRFELTANGGASAPTIAMDDESFVFPAGQTPTVGTCYESVTGVMHIQPFDNIRTINPRQVGDLVVGTDCE